jgi:hypothetical protein
MNIKHLQGPYKPVFMDETEIRQTLNSMEQDATLRTSPSYITNTPEAIGLVSFRKKHLTYLKEHPKVNPQHYLSNLKTMIKIRS